MNIIPYSGSRLNISVNLNYYESLYIAYTCISFLYRYQDRDFSLVCEASKRKNQVPGNRIVGGKKSSPGAYPWIVNLFTIPRCNENTLNEVLYQ